MSGNDSVIALSNCYVSPIVKYHSEEQLGKSYHARRVEWQGVAIGDWGAAVNNAFSDLFLAGCRDPHKKLCEWFFAVINGGFVPLTWGKKLGARASFHIRNEESGLTYDFVTECRKCAVSAPRGAEDLTWWIGEYFGDDDMFPEKVFLASIFRHHTDDDTPELMGKKVSQWNRAAVHLSDVEHPFARKICEIAHQLQGVRVCS